MLHFTHLGNQTTNLYTILKCTYKAILDTFRAGEYPEALALYTEGLAFQPSALLHNNRAAVLMHM